MLTKKWRARLLFITTVLVGLMLGHLGEKVSVSALRQKIYQLRSERDLLIVQNYGRKRELTLLSDRCRVEEIARLRGLHYPAPKQMIALTLDNEGSIAAAIRSGGKLGRKIERTLFPRASAEMEHR